LLGDSITILVIDGLREHTFSSALTHWELGGASCMEGKHVDEYRQDMEPKKQK